MTSAVTTETVQVVAAGSINKRVPSPGKMASIYSSTTNSSTKLSSTANGGCLLNRRPKVHRAPGLIPATVNDVRQRVHSAKVLRMKQLQNQLTDARQHIAELTTENRLLKAIHKRQDSALAKYERSNADLPQLLNAHAEEMRVWQSKCRSLKQQNKELQERMKQKDSMILTISDQNKHLTQLNRDRNLEEREKLSERLKDIEQRLMDKDNDVKLLSRRLQLEMKAYKLQLHQDHQKYRDCYSKLERAHAEISRLTNVIESHNLKDSPSFKPKVRARNRSADDINRAAAVLEAKKSSTNKPEPIRFLSPMRKEESPKAKPRKPKESPPTIGIDEDDDEFLLPLPPIQIPTYKSMELHEHRRHIEELEAKLKPTTTKASKAIETLGRIDSPAEAGFENFEDEQNELENMKKQLKDNLIKKENFLDAICDEITKQSPLKKQEPTKKVAAKKTIDPNEKKKLLAAMKAIDGNADSFEK